MFERLVIRLRSSASLGRPPDLGVLAEALLFYSEVRLATNHHAGLPAILRAESPEVLSELLEPSVPISVRHFASLQLESSGRTRRRFLEPLSVPIQE